MSDSDFVYRDAAILKNRYYDSVFLMRVARTIREKTGVADAVAVMATEANLEILDSLGFAIAEFEAQPTDLVIAVSDRSQEVVADTLGQSEQWLESGSERLTSTVWSLEGARQRLPGSNLAAISVPGQYARSLSEEAIGKGMNVFLFSDNVSVEDEVALKSKSRTKDVLVMGPDCGTAIIGGVGLGFANKVRRGPIGVVASSRTGLQEFTSLVHALGSGISHAIGSGSRDLSDAVGGTTTLRAIDLLLDDPETHVVAVVGKPPGTVTRRKLMLRLEDAPKQVVVCLLGSTRPGSDTARLHEARTIDEAAGLAVSLATAREGSTGTGPDASGAGAIDWDKNSADLLSSELARHAPGRNYVRGLFAGGTFCYQAQFVLVDLGLAVASNTPIPGGVALDDPDISIGHCMVDLGDDRYTVGRPHPMIDATERSRRVRAEAKDPRVAVILLDFVLGTVVGEPVADLAPAISDARAAVPDRGSYLSFVASVCGTEEDPQSLSRQEQLLENLGVVVAPNASAAARFAGQIALHLGVDS